MSKITYLIIKLLVDRSKRNECFMYYNLLRRVDDEVDFHLRTRKERVNFVKNERKLVSGIKEAKLKSYMENFFDVIEFDAERKDRKITKKEFEWYTRTLSIAVTDGILYFIDGSHPYRQDTNMYKAAEAAHIVHILRDYDEDQKNGFYNIPEGLTKEDLGKMAREKFMQGKKYINTLPLRPKIAAYLYCLSFEYTLQRLEKI